MTTIRRAAAVAAALSLTAALAACADSTTDGAAQDPTTSSRTWAGATRSSEPAAPPASSSSTTTDTPAADSPASDTSQPAGAGAPLSSIVLQRADVPARYNVSGEAHAAASGSADEDALHRCIGVPTTSSQRTEGYVSASWSTITNGVTSATSRYRSQAAVTAEAALLRSPKAKQCFTTYFRTQAVKFHDGETPVSSTLEVRPGTNDGPTNEAGVVSGTFTFKGNSGAPVDFRIGIYYFTGPRLVTQLLLLGFGADLADDLQTTPLLALAKRTAAG